MERLSQVVRRLLARVIRQHMKRALQLTWTQWRLAGSACRQRRPTTQQALARKLGLKSSGGSPTMRLLRPEGSAVKKGYHPLVSPRASKRPISVSPCDSPKATASFQLGPVPKSALDVGTRLYQKAQEIENKLDAMRKAQEPEYTFTPSLARNTDRWLNQKSAKSTPKKQRAPEEDVAVVSSAAVSLLSRLADYSGQVRKVSPPEEPSNYVLVDFTGDDSLSP